VEKLGELAGFASVEAEVSRTLALSGDFRDADPGTPDYVRKASGLFRGNARGRVLSCMVAIIFPRDGPVTFTSLPGTFAAMIARVRNKEQGQS
jgi:hypothetical protein